MHPTSMFTFVFSTVCSLLLFYNGVTYNNKYDILFGTIVILIGLMQLVEFFLWKNQKSNHIFSLFIIILLFLQIFITFIVYYTLYPSNHVFNNNSILIYLLTYTIFTLYLLYYLNQTTLHSKPAKNSCRLAWAPYTFLLQHNIPLLIIHLFLYLSGMIMIAIECYKSVNTTYWVRYLYLPITFILCLFFVINESSLSLNYIDVFGTVWCFTAVFLGIISLLHI